MMLKKLKKISTANFITILLILMIFAWPFINSFFGIDMGDTGLHTYIFQNLYTTPELIGFTTWLTAVVGNLWLKLFGFLGLWSLNLLEVILEMIIVVVVYNTFKKYINRNVLLLGSLLAIFASNTYLNAFNSHQFNVLLLALLMCTQFKAIIKKSYKMDFLAGLILGLVVFARIGSITAVVTVLLYIYWFLANDEVTLKDLFKHFASMALGFILCSLSMIAILKFTGQLGYFINNVFRIKGLATESGGGYSFSNLWDSFFTGNLDAIGAGAIFFFGLAIVLVAFLFAFRKYKQEKVWRSKTLDISMSAIFLMIGLYLMHYSYDVNPTPAWPQMTSGPSFMIGVMYVAAIGNFIYSYHTNKEKSLLIIISLFLPLLTIAGSNTGTKHVILGMWIIAPILCDTIYSLFFDKKTHRQLLQIVSQFNFTNLKMPMLLTLVVFILLFTYKLGDTVYRTNNFDSIHRTKLTASIHSDNAKFLKTTKRQAKSVNGVLEVVDILKEQYGEDTPMMMYGGSLLFYYLTDSVSYVQPWVTISTYPLEQYVGDLNAGKERYDQEPIVIYGKTNNYYGYYEENRATLAAAQAAATDNGKKNVFANFLRENEYDCVYENDYYAVFSQAEDGEGNFQEIKSILGIGE